MKGSTSPRPSRRGRIVHRLTEKRASGILLVQILSRTPAPARGAHLAFVEILISRNARKKLNRSFRELRSPEVFLDRQAKAAKMLLSPSPFFDGDRSGFIQTACFPGRFAERVSLLSGFSVGNLLSSIGFGRLSPVFGNEDFDKSSCLRQSLRNRAACAPHPGC